MDLTPGRNHILPTLLLVVGLAAVSLRAESPVGTVLIDDDFERDVPGAKPPGWAILVDEGNDVTVVDSPALGKRSVKFTDTGGTVWKPLMSGSICGEANNCLRLDFDWCLKSTYDDHKKAFTVSLRGDGNIATVSVAIGGPGGVAVYKKGKEWLPLGVPVRLNQWNHLTIISDPISYGAKGAFDVIVTQGGERGVFENVPFSCRGTGEYPKTYWYSPCFSLAGGASAGPGKEAYIDNVKLSVVAERIP
jgi:hypothetical protein